MFCKHDEKGYKEVFPGIQMKTIVYGDKTLMTKFIMKEGSVLPEHNHIHEQTGYLISGRMRLSIGKETFEVTSGDSWAILENESHNAVILEDSIAIEVFSPRRDEFID